MGTESPIVSGRVHRLSTSTEVSTKMVAFFSDAYLSTCGLTGSIVFTFGAKKSTSFLPPFHLSILRGPLRRLVW
jgi:hypothetical protein